MLFIFKNKNVINDCLLFSYSFVILWSETEDAEKVLFIVNLIISLKVQIAFYVYVSIDKILTNTGFSVIKHKKTTKVLPSTEAPN